jgi:hypothetical protein
MRDEDELRRTVVFCILMENDDGIMGKAPSYVAEKFSAAYNTYIEPESLLDAKNKAKYAKWLVTWLL